MIIQVLNRVDDVRDLCEKRCEQLRRLATPICRPVQRVHPLPTLHQNESLNLIGTTTAVFQLDNNEQSFSSNHNHQTTTHTDSDSSINQNAKMDKKQRLE